MAELPPPFLWDADSHTHLLEQFVTIHDDCIVHDHQLLTFLPDETTGRVDRTKLIKYWQQEATAVRDGLKDVIVQMSDDKRQGVVAGLVVLYKPPSETGPFRGVVEKLMVSPLFRRRGVARRLNLKLEEVAIQNNRGLLVSDENLVYRTGARLKLGSDSGHDNRYSCRTHLSSAWLQRIRRSPWLWHQP